MNVPILTQFKCNKIFKLSDQYKRQVSNYIFQLLRSNIQEERESSLLTKEQIKSNRQPSTRLQNNTPKLVGQNSENIAQKANYIEHSEWKCSMIIYYHYLSLFIYYCS